MRRRLDIAASLIVTPGVLFLDEPTTGLDPNARQGVWRMIRELAEFRRHHPAHHAISRRGRPARRPHRRHRQGQEDRRGHEPRAEGGHRLRLPACRARRSGASSTRPRRILEAHLGGSVQRGSEGAELSIMAGTPKAANEALAALIAAGIELADFSMGSPEPRGSVLRADRRKRPPRQAAKERRHERRPTSAHRRSARGRSPRPPAPSAFSNALVFGWRAVLKFKHVPEQLFDLVMTPIMFTLLFTFVFGGALAGSTGEYLQFFLPGILVQTVVLQRGLFRHGAVDRSRQGPVRPLPLAADLVARALRRADGGRHPAPPDRRRRSS